MMRVDLNPKSDIKPIDERTESITMHTPAKPRQMRESTKRRTLDLNSPSAITM